MDFAKIEEEEEDHFSFPIATTSSSSPPHFVEPLPPLWWHPISPTSTCKNPENSKGKEVANEQNYPNKYPFQDFEVVSKNEQRQFSCSPFCDDVDEGEKMDLLWENLNEELISGKNSAVSSPGREVKMICIKGLKLSKTRRGMLSERRLGILMLFKFFKKVFALHYSRNSVKKTHCV